MRIVLIFIISYIVFAILLLPAKTVYGWIEESLEPLHFSQLEGSIWQAEAKAEIDKLLLEDWHWHWQPLALLTGKIGFQNNLKVLGGYAKGSVGVSLIGPILSHFNIVINAENLTPYIVGLSLKGRLALDIKYAHIKTRKIKGQLSWQRAELILGPPITLGEVLLTLTPQPTGTEAIIENKAGQIVISGVIKLTVDTLAINIRLKPIADAPPNVASTLRLIGNIEADGSVVIDKKIDL